MKVEKNNFRCAAFSPKFVCLILLCLLCLPAVAASKKKAKKAPEAVVKVDTVSVDSFSYALGLANSNGLKDYLVQRMGVDVTYMEDFLKGFQQCTFSEADKREKARIAGLEIRRQVEDQVFPTSNKQVNDTVDLLRRDRFVQGFFDGVSGKNATLSMDSAQAVVKRQMDFYHREKMERLYGANRVAGEEFLKANAKKDSVRTTPSGLQYKVLTQGTGEIPTPEKRVRVHYEGRLIDGTVFDSSYERNKPTMFTVNGVIKGWIEALCMMPKGSKWEVYVPQQLAYGDREQGKIPPFSCLIFTVELLDVLPAIDLDNPK